MRAVVLAVIVLAAVAGAGAHAQVLPINLDSASATYWTATDEIEFRLTFNQPPDLETHAFRLGMREYWWRHSPTAFRFENQSFAFDGVQWHNVEFPSTEVTVIQSLSRALAPDCAPVYERCPRQRPIGTLDYAIDGNTLITSGTFEELGISVLPHPIGFSAQTHEKIDGLWIGNRLYLRLHTDEVVAYNTPEPSSVALASFGVVALVAHRLRSRSRAATRARSR
jgi:hypothetical protein